MHNQNIIPCQVSRTDKDKERTATVEAIKTKEAGQEVIGGRCSKKICYSWLTVTGEPIEGHIEMFCSETWILPLSVLFAMVVYAGLAIVFYKKDA